MNIMRIVVILLGAVISTSALVFWLGINGLAREGLPNDVEFSINWLSKDAFVYFWLPFLAGGVIAVMAGKARKSREN